MQANPRSLDSLFNSQMRYVVPMFQRLYVWQRNPQWETLWEDITEKAVLQLRGTKSNAHYLGAVIIEGVRPNSPREVKRFLVIDGQQRLTTLQLVFCAYRDLARKNGWKTQDRATTRYLENVDSDVMEHPEEEVFKLWPTSLNRGVFTKLLTAQSRASIEAKFPLVRLPRKRKPQPRSNLVEAYLYFSTAIETWIGQAASDTGKNTEDCAFALLQALQQDFCVVEIALSEGDDSQEIFYSLNSQGRPLSQSDLLRSLIFMRAEKDNVSRDVIFDTYWSKFETEFWSTETARGGRTYSNLDLALRYFLMAKSGELVDARRVNEEYRRWVSSSPPRYMTVKEELEDFTRYGERFRHYHPLNASALPSTDLRRVLLDLDVSTATPLILFVELDAGVSEPEVGTCLAILESFLVRRAITGDDTKEYNKFFVELIGVLRAVSPQEVPKALTKKLLEGGGSTRRWPTDAELLESAIGGPLYRTLKTPALRLILERLETAMRTKKSEGVEIPAGLQIEHVLPIAWAEHWPLDGKSIPANIVYVPAAASGELANLADAIRARNLSLQTLGNLTLLNKYLNPAASHGSFQTKLHEYKNSVLRLNRYFDGLQTWDEDSIRERGKALASMISAIWPRAGLT
jgi:uncharacterized protein DUF262/uncharacterized protein DUF1524